MSGYLQRLAASAQPATRGALRPYVTSRSPIAENDQRVSLPGFETAGLVPAEQASFHAGEGQAPTAGPPAPPSVPAPENGPAFGGARPAEAEAFGSAAPPTPQRAWGARPPRDRVGVHGSSSEAAPGPTAIAPRPRVPGSVRPADRAAGSVHGADAARVGGHATSPPRTEPRAPVASAPPSTSTDLSESEEDGPPSIPLPADSRPADAEGPRRRRAAAARGPRLEIGTIEVEVVPPPRAEPRPAPPARPLTAESASQIGPLATRRRSNLRYALRLR